MFSAALRAHAIEEFPRLGREMPGMIRVRMDIEGRFQMQSRHTSIKSEGLVAIDGKKINLG